MICERVRRQLGVYRELDRTERRAVARHLRNCDTCRQHWRDEQAVRALVGAVPVLDAPRGLERRLLAIPELAPRPVLSRPVPWLTLAVTSLLLGAATLAWESRGTPPSASLPPASQAAIGATETGPATAVARRLRPPAPAAAASEDLLLAQAEPQAEPPTHRPRAAGGRSAPIAAPDEPPLGPPAKPQPAAGAQPEPQRPRSTATPAPQRPAPSPTPATACVSVTALVFADLAGAGGLACPGCDGAFSDEDVALAKAAGLVLPGGMQVALYDLSEPGGHVLKESRLAPDGAAVAHEVGEVCGRLPIFVQLKLPAGSWAACPVTGSLERRVELAGEVSVSFPLTAGCPAPSPSPTSPPASPTPTAPATSEAGALPALPTVSPTSTPTPDRPADEVSAP